MIVASAFDGCVCRWQSDDGSKFNDFDAVTVSLLERARIDGQHQAQVAERNWSFDLVAMTQTNVTVRPTLL